MLGQDSEGDQHRDQHADRQCVVDQLGRQEEQVLGYFRHRDLILRDVAEQLEERVDLGQQDEAGQHQDEIEKELGEHVGVDQLRKQREAAALGQGSGLELPAEVVITGGDPSPDRA